MSTLPEHSDSLPHDPADSTLLLASWLERRLDATTPWELDEARLYGVTVRDRDALAGDAPDAARYCLLDRGYPYDIVEGPASLLAANFDALALLTLGWRAPLDDASIVRPSRHPDRIRVRVVSVVLIDPIVDASSLATAIRNQYTDTVDAHANTIGPMADALLNLAAEALATRLVA